VERWSTWRQGAPLRTILPTPGRAFYGHGAYTADGSALLAVETALDTHAGLLSVRDPDNFRRVDEFPTFGCEPARLPPARGRKHPGV